jgi:hypothetical protein
MARLDTAAIVERIDQLLRIRSEVGDYASAVEVLNGTLTLARLLYGNAEEAPQVHVLMKQVEAARERGETFQRTVVPAAQGALRTMKAEVERGLIGNVTRLAAGEVLGDMLALAKEALSEDREEAKNVAAVLTAAAYEDTLRRLAAMRLGLTDRVKLQDVLAALKNGGVLLGAAFTTANGYLKFRNDALHADWEHINAAVVESCLAFTEGLLVEHFS